MAPKLPSPSWAERDRTGIPSPIILAACKIKVSSHFTTHHSPALQPISVGTLTLRMPSYLNSSRIRKPLAPSLRRHSSSPFTAASRVKPSPQRAKSLAKAYEDAEDGHEERLGATSVTLSTMPDTAAVDVLSAMHHATDSFFCSIPERAGMNSTRISEVLNFQKNLPQLVSLAHVHALISASSKTEREISALITMGKIRRIRIVGRGNDISGASDFLITTAALTQLLSQSGLSEPIVESFIQLLAEHPRAISLPPNNLLPTHITSLIAAGFLVSSSSVTRNLSLAGSSVVATASISRAFSGTSGAVGGDAAFENLGGVGSARPSTATSHNIGADLLLSTPNIGVYTRLLTAGRAHLIELLRRSAYREAPLYLLRERWDGAVDGEHSMASKARNVRGVFSEVMPAKTKKWRKLWGMRFEWAVAECLGAGLAEIFETGSVGLGIRALS